MSLLINRTGQKFGRLTVLDKHKFENSHTYWWCRCDCGNEKWIKRASLTTGGTRSCGCLRRELGMGTVRRWHLAAGEAARNSVLYQYKKQAKDRNLPWELSDKQALDLFAQNCHYCGSAPNNKRGGNRFNSEAKKCNGDFIYNGIDRKDNTKGYTTNNCAPCCSVCNRMKRTMGVDVFIAHVERIMRYFKQKREEI